MRVLVLLVKINVRVAVIQLVLMDVTQTVILVVAVVQENVIQLVLIAQQIVLLTV